LYKFSVVLRCLHHPWLRVIALPVLYSRRCLVQLSCLSLGFTCCVRLCWSLKTSVYF